MRYIVSIVLLLYGCLFFGAISAPKDSLVNLLNKTTDSFQKVSIYRNLADICFEEPEEIPYLKNTCIVSQRIGKKDVMFDAFSELVAAYIKLDQLDSARYYMKIMEKKGSRKENEYRLTFLTLKMFDVEISSKDNEKLLEENLKPLKDKQQSVYKRFKQSYIMGSALLFAEKPDKAIPYYETAFRLCPSMPEKERGKLENLVLWQLAHAYAYNGEILKTIDIIELLIRKQEINYNKYYKPERPFYNINTRYIQSYTFLLSCITHLSKEKAELYMKWLQNYSKGSISLSDKYSVFLAFYNYNVFHRNFEKAVEMNDSLIKYAKDIAQYNLPGLYKVGSRLYAFMGKYKEAYENVNISYAMKDSLTTEKLNTQLTQLQVKYDVDKLNHEKTLLEIKNKQIMVLCLSLILFIFIGICIYQYYVLRKEKRMKEKLRKLNIKAEESENMKTAFINSVCHEIRTPLNAIVGFSELALDDSIDIEVKKSFPEEIQKNTILLTSLINDMLEVSNLDSSREELPCEPENLKDICVHVMDKFKMDPKEGIEYILDLSDDDPVISTHRRYLSLVLEHLLSNAVKFTERGHIAISYRIDRSKKELLLSVEDTGCGIPSEKQELVFQRFVKLDSFKQGNGLGLYLCQLIVTRLSGKIYIDSQYKKGVRFIIKVPV